MQSKTRIHHPNPESQRKNVTWRITDRNMNYATLTLYIKKKKNSGHLKLMLGAIPEKRKDRILLNINRTLKKIFFGHAVWLVGS